MSGIYIDLRKQLGHRRKDKDRRQEILKYPQNTAMIDCDSPSAPFLCGCRSRDAPSTSYVLESDKSLLGQMDSKSNPDQNLSS